VDERISDDERNDFLRETEGDRWNVVVAFGLLLCRCEDAKPREQKVGD